MNIMAFIVAIIIISTNAFSQTNTQDLKCSANGTTVIHIPGAFTSAQDQLRAKTELKDRILFGNLNYFDLKKQDADVISIASQGILQDKLNYILNSYGDEGERAWIALGTLEYGYKLYGNVKAVSEAGGLVTKLASSNIKGTIHNIKNLDSISANRSPSQILSLFRAQLNLSGQGVRAVNSMNNEKPLMYTLSKGGTGTGFANKLLSLTGLANLSSPGGWGLLLKNVLNMASLWTLEGSLNQAIANDQDNLLTAYYTTQDNVNNIASQIRIKLNANQKVILSAHAEGNQLAERAIAQIQNTGTAEEKKKLSKIVSVVATSPTTESYSDKYLYMKNNYDVRYFGGSNVPANYVLNKKSFAPQSMAAFLADLFKQQNLGQSRNNFLKYYIGEVVKGSKNEFGSAESSMRDNYIAELRQSAESLESSCGEVVTYFPIDVLRTFFTKMGDFYDDGDPAYPLHLQPYRENRKLQLEDGDLITMEISGAYSPSYGIETTKSTAAVFSDGTNFLYAGSRSENIQRDIQRSNERWAAPPQTFYLSVDSRYPSRVEVPVGAKYIYLSPVSGVFYDNQDADANYALKLTIEAKYPLEDN